MCGILPIFFCFIEPHESRTVLDEIVCFFHYKQAQNMWEQLLLLWFFTDLGPDFTSLTSGRELWRCAYITASELLAECIKTEWKNYCDKSRNLCLSAAKPKLVRVKRFRAAVWKTLKGNNDSFGLNVTEEKAIMRKGGKGKNQSGHSCGGAS